MRALIKSELLSGKLRVSSNYMMEVPTSLVKISTKIKELAIINFTLEALAAFLTDEAEVTKHAVKDYLAMLPSAQVIRIVHPTL